MVPATRRALLHGATGLLTALAGCSGLLGGSAEQTRTASSEGSAAGPASGSTTDPETLLLRVATDRPPVWLSEPNGEGDGRPTPRERDRWRDSIVVDDSARADRLSVVDRVDRDRVESFLAATEFATETVYVETGAVEECFRLDLCHVSWTPTEISTDYARRSRPYTERCAVDEWVTETRLIRIPDAIEAEDVDSYSSSVGTGVCDRRRSRGESAGGGGSRPGDERGTGTGTTTGSGPGTTTDTETGTTTGSGPGTTTDAGGGQ
jgi:hypothetical protein